MNFLGKLRIRNQLLIFAVSTVLIMIVIFSSFYSENAKIIVKKNTEYTSETISQIKQNISNYCDSVNRLITSMAYTMPIQNYMTETDMLKKYELDQQIVDLLNKTKQLIGDGVMDIVTIGDNGNYSTLNGNLDFVEQVKEVFKDKNSPFFTEIKNLQYQGRENKCFLVGMTVISVDKNYKNVGSKIGLFCILIDAYALSPDIGKKSGVADNKFYLLDRENSIFSSNDSVATGQRFKIIEGIERYEAGTYVEVVNGEKSLIQIDELPALGGRIISIVPEKRLFAELIRTQKRVLLMFFIAIILLFIPFYIIMNNITNPLKKFMHFINNVKSGNLKSLKNRIQLEGYAEMSIMSQEFNSMLDEIDNLTHRLIDTNTRLYQSELEKKQSELAFLQSQINPHFLYNTLESIKGIAAVKGVMEIRDMTKALSHIFRYSIKGSDEVCLNEEIDIVRSYVQIQQIRFLNRFQVIYDFSEITLACQVPKMILQPIVENAIYHGLEPKTEKGTLFITGRIEGNTLEIKIEDDGVGIENEALQELRSELSFVRNRVGYSRIGIVNVNNRIKLRYGEGFGVSVTSELGIGTKIVITIPAGG